MIKKLPSSAISIFATILLLAITSSCCTRTKVVKENYEKEQPTSLSANHLAGTWTVKGYHADYFTFESNGDWHSKWSDWYGTWKIIDNTLMLHPEGSNRDKIRTTFKEGNIILKANVRLVLIKS